MTGSTAEELDGPGTETGSTAEGVPSGEVGGRTGVVVPMAGVLVLGGIMDVDGGIPVVAVVVGETLVLPLPVHPDD